MADLEDGAPQPAARSSKTATADSAPAPAPPGASASASVSTAPSAVTPLVAPTPRQQSYFTYAFGLAAGALSAYLLVQTVAEAGSVLTLVLLAAFFAVSLNPIVTALTKQSFIPVPRWAAVLLVGLGVLGVVAGFLAAIVPPVAEEVAALVHAIPHVLQEIQDHNTWLGQMEAKYHVVSKVQSALSSRGIGSSAVSDLVGTGKYVLSTLTSTLAVVALTIYFLAGLPHIVRTAYRTVPSSRRPRVQELGDEILTQVGRYMLGSLINASIAGAATFIWTASLGIPYPAALGLLVALMDMIPVVGSTIGGAIVTLVALSNSVPIAIATLVFYIAFRLTEDYILLPKVMRHAVNVPPIVTVVAVLIGGSLLGVIGALVAIPTAAALKLITVEVLMPRLNQS
jgi:predicted PurR-regulated permease PerM